MQESKIYACKSGSLAVGRYINKLELVKYVFVDLIEIIIMSLNSASIQFEEKTLIDLIKDTVYT